MSKLSLEKFVSRNKAFCFMAIIAFCCAGCGQKRSWQKNEDFKERREILYNKFIESGGAKIRPDMTKLQKTRQKQILKELQETE